MSSLGFPALGLVTGLLMVADAAAVCHIFVGTRYVFATIAVGLDGFHATSVLPVTTDRFL